MSPISMCFPFQRIEFVIVFQFFVQVRAAFVHLFGFLEEGFGGNGEEFGRIGGPVFI